MIEPIHIHFSFRDCFKDVMCCSGNDNRQMSLAEEFALYPEPGYWTRFGRMLTFRNHLTRRENELIRIQFSVYMSQTYHVAVRDLSTEWEESATKLLTRSERYRLLDLAETQHHVPSTTIHKVSLV